jgi:hypothetical protein
VPSTGAMGMVSTQRVKEPHRCTCAWRARARGRVGVGVDAVCLLPEQHATCVAYRRAAVRCTTCRTPDPSSNAGQRDTVTSVRPTLRVYAERAARCCRSTPPPLSAHPRRHRTWRPPNRHTKRVGTKNAIPGCRQRRPAGPRGHARVWRARRGARAAELVARRPARRECCCTTPTQPLVA